MTKPVLTDYLSSTRYLEDLYKFHKTENPGFSFDAWAAAMGFKSRSFLKMLINRERSITPQFIGVFSRHMGYSAEDTRYFTLMVRHTQAVNPEERTFYLDKIFEFRGQSKEKMEIEPYRQFLSSPLIPKVFILLSFHDVKPATDTLALLLGRPPAEIADALEHLRQMGLVQYGARGWESLQKSFKIPKNPGCEAMENYHNLCLQEAIAAQKAPAELRRFRSVMLPLSEEDYQNLLIEVQALVSKTLSKYDSDTLAGKRLYKMNLNLFPVSGLHALRTKSESPGADDPPAPAELT